MVGHSERLGVSDVGEFESQLFLDGDPPALAENSVEVHRSRHRGNAILAEKDGSDSSRSKEVQEITHDRIDTTQVIGHCGMLRAQPLKVVVEVRQVDEVERRRVLLLNPLGRPGNPPSGRIGRALRRLHAGSRPPEGCERKVAQGLLQGRAQIIRPSVDIEELASIGRVHWPGRH